MVRPVLLSLLVTSQYQVLRVGADSLFVLSTSFFLLNTCEVS